jgi:hypothetical protein
MEEDEPTDAERADQLNIQAWKQGRDLASWLVDPETGNRVEGGRKTPRAIMISPLTCINSANNSRLVSERGIHIMKKSLMSYGWLANVR